jgi:hypothetical protein
VSRDRPTTPEPAGTPRWASHIDIPTDWTPEQALAVFELLDQLRDAVATLHLDRIQTLLQQQQGRAADTADLGDAAGDEPAF